MNKSGILSLLVQSNARLEDILFEFGSQLEPSVRKEIVDIQLRLVDLIEKHTGFHGGE